MSSAEHWENVYRTRDVTDVSWFQAEPEPSLRLIEAAGPSPRTVVDVGGGASLLVDRLAERGVDVTVVDISAAALDVVRKRLEGEGLSATLVQADVLEWRPPGLVDVWHDRAALHFIADPSDRQRYARTALDAVRPGGALVIAAFAPDGPTHCSGLPVQQRDAQALAAEFADGATLEVAEAHDHLTPAGATQRFTWVVLRRS